MAYVQQLWINSTRTVLVTKYSDGTMTVAFREDESDIWGPPVTVFPTDH
jgi:hypothetical protein